MPRTNATRSPKRGTVAMELLETQETRARDMRVFCVCVRARFFLCARASTWGVSIAFQLN